MHDVHRLARRQPVLRHVADDADRLRGLRATGIVTGECSSAALWPFAACTRRLVTPCSVLLFHPMRWQSEENVGLAEAAEWARHFGQLEKEMDACWPSCSACPPGRDGQSGSARASYVSGREMAERPAWPS